MVSRRVRNLLLTLAAIAAVGWPASAKVITDAKTRYQTRDGPSDWRTTEVTLMKGTELNVATHTSNYAPYDGYVVIWFAQGQAAVIHLSNTIFGCATTFEIYCVPQIGNMEGADQSGRRWEICTSQIC